MRNQWRYGGVLVLLGLLASCGRTQLDTSRTDEAVSCAPPTLDCGGGVCVDPLHDPRNCGSCGSSCGAGKFCDEGRCLEHCVGAGCSCVGEGCNVSCVDGELACRELNGQLACVDPQTDMNHCGACDRVCSPGSRCQAGECCTDDLCCDAPLAACLQSDGSLACTDTTRSNDHCGGCGMACQEGTTCVGGACEQCSPLQFFVPVAERTGPLDDYALVRPLVYDVDGDGHLDVVTPSAAGSTLMLSHGDGHGAFGPPERLETLVGPRAVVAGDFNGDGKTDLAALGSAGIMIHWAPYDGAWARIMVVHDGDPQGATFVALATLQHPDETATRLVYVTQSSAGSGIYLTDSVGGVKGSLIHESTQHLNRVQTGDFDADGQLDIAAWDKTGDMLWGQGGRAFQIAVGFIDPKSTSERPLLFADLDGDGLADMLTGEGFGQGTLFYGYYYRTHLATPSGTFQELPRGDATTASTSPKIELGDFNHDGVPDLFSREEESSTLYTFKGVGDGSFEALGSSAVAADKNGIRGGDFDEDGQLDVVALHNGAQAFTTHLGRADGSFSSSLLSLPEQTYLRDAQIHHYPDRAAPSIVVVGGLDEGRLRLLDVDASLRASQAQEVPIYRPLSLSLGDVDGDGEPDAIVPAEQNLYWVRYVGGQFAAEAQTLFALRSVYRTVSADFAGVGRPKVVALSLGLSTSTIHVLTNQGTAWTDTPFEVGSGTSMAVGDVLGDGLPELVVASSKKLQVFRIEAAGGASELTSVEVPWSHPEVDLADIDGDGDREMVLGGFDNEGHAVYDIDAGGGLVQLAKADLPRFWNYDRIDRVRSHAADIDGDGLADLLEISHTGVAARWLGRGDGTFERDETYLVPGSRELVGLDDFDADGHPDMLLKGGSEYAGALLVLRGATQCE